MSAPIDTSPPIVIPTTLRHDRAIRRLLMAWCHAHARFRLCAKRVNWRNAVSKSIEKKRRTEKWICVAKILEIEHTLLRWIGHATKHPDLWMPPSGATRSRRYLLRRAYATQRGLEHNLHGEIRKTALAHRAMIVAEIRALDRAWMTALLAAVHPTLPIPTPLPLHPRELVPRKIKTAAKRLDAELAAVNTAQVPP